MKTDIFESDVTDYRVTYLWNEITEKSGTRYISGENINKKGCLMPVYRKVPLIRLYEMYLIAIECSDLETEYKPLVDELVAARNISVVNVSTVDLKNRFCGQRISERILWRRTAVFSKPNAGVDKTILWTDTEGSKAVYVLPLPKSEIKFE